MLGLRYINQPPYDLQRQGSMTTANDPGILIIFGGLPGSGKTSIARELARRAGGFHIRLDTIEQAMRDSGQMTGDIYDAGYRVAYAVALDNLRLGQIVVADSVNPLEVTRRAWRDVADAAPAAYLEVEVICTDAEEHRRRVETRATDVANLVKPTWAQVMEREYEVWTSPGLIVLDSATLSVDEAIAQIEARLAAFEAA